LIELLETSSSYKVRMQVLVHLAQLEHELGRVDAALRRALSDDSAAVRRVAGAVLARRGIRPRALPPTRRAARAHEQDRAARERQHQHQDRIFVAVGTLASGARTGGREMARIFEAALRRELDAVSGVTTRWEGGAPSAAELVRRRMKGFVLDGAIKSLRRQRGGGQDRYACEVKISFATYPGNSMKAFYTGEASTSVPAGSLAAGAERRIYGEIVRSAARGAKERFVRQYLAPRTAGVHD
jgi:hypothetical protein